MGGDADSGMSTSHSPEDNYKAWRCGGPGAGAGAGRAEDGDTLSPVSPALDSASMATRLELLDPTHRGLHRCDTACNVTPDT